jgi:hypothetical protein
LATKEELRQRTFASLASLCQKVTECPDTPSETAKEARELRKELLGFTTWAEPGESRKQKDAEEKALRNRAVNFLYDEHPFWT